MARATARNALLTAVALVSSGGARPPRWRSPDGTAAASCINATALSRVVYINMDHRLDRRKWMETNLAHLPVPVSVRRAEGLRVSFEEASSLLPDEAANWTRPRVIGAGGCLKSKLDVLRGLLAEHRQRSNSRPQHSLILLLEDDWRIKQPERLLAHLGTLLTRAIRSNRMDCRPNLVRLDCWRMPAWKKGLESCNAREVVGRCRCGGTHAMLVPTWGLAHLIKVYTRKLGEADCALSHLSKSFCLNVGIMLQGTQQAGFKFTTDIPK
jgi:hypothetical protein